MSEQNTFERTTSEKSANERLVNERLANERRASDRPMRPVAELVPELGSQFVHLLKSEADLVRAEVNEKIDNVEQGLGSMAAGGACLLAALLILLQAIVVALVNAGIGAGWASLIVGAATAVIGIALLFYGSGKVSHLTPERSMRQAGRTASMLREKTQ